MKIFKVIIGVPAILLLAASAFSAELGWLRISLIEGDVSVKMTEADDWGAAALNGPLAEGDQVWAPEGGRVELQMHSGSYIRLDEYSALQILSLDKENSQFYLSEGNVYVYFRARPGSVMQVDTPDASTRAFDDAVFRIDITDRYTDVAVYKGYVETENQLGRTRINAGQTLSLVRDTEGDVAPMGPPDDWERWNKERNDRLLTRDDPSSRYLPPELSAYAYDFTIGGRWVHVPAYGYCWTPLDGLNDSWAPYRRGRWAWIGGDYVWISADPWGWVPYHYGRWAFVGGIGWCWVPPLAGDVYWGPGFVGWVQTNDYVAWVPLAPGEIYYGHGHFGRHSVNITTININQVTITQVFRNVQVRNAAVVVRRHTFAAGSPRVLELDRNIRQRLFVRENIRIGRPDIRPSREGHFMSLRNIPPTKRPPQPIRNVEVRRLRELRPLVRERDKSVLNRGESPRQLPLNTVTTPRTPGRGRPPLRPVTPVMPGREDRRDRKGPDRREVAPEGLPPREAMPQVKPREQRPVTPEGLPVRPPARDDRRDRKGPERREVAPEGLPPREVIPQVSPPARRPEVKPREPRPVTPETAPVRPPARDDRRNRKGPERREVAPEGLPPREMIPQVSPPARRPERHEAPVPGIDRPQAKPQERKSVESEDSSQGDKKETTPDDGSQKGRNKGKSEEERRRR